MISGGADTDKLYQLKAHIILHISAPIANKSDMNKSSSKKAGMTAKTIICTASSVLVATEGAGKKTAEMLS